MKTFLHLSPIATFTRPFHYVVSTAVFDLDVSHAILSWLESTAPWQRVTADFYEQFECSLWEAQLPPHLAFLREHTLLTALRQQFTALFGVTFSHHVDITAHKLVPGQRIRLHNDFIPGAETHRLLIQLNRDWPDENGGFLLLFQSPDPADIHKIFRPVHNSAIGFAITPTSYHAVSAIHAGERFTLVYSLYEQEGHESSF